MKKFRLAIFLFTIFGIWGVQGDTCLGQPPYEITYAGVTHVVGQRDVRTFFDLGINDLPTTVVSAYVKDPDNLKSELKWEYILVKNFMFSKFSLKWLAITWVNLL